MLGRTHALAGACTAGLFLAFNIPHQYPLIALSVVGGFAALFPDLDNSESTLENIRVFGLKIFEPPAYIIDKLFKHRGFLHSLIAVALLGFIFLGFFPDLPKEVVIAVLLGYLSHLVTDGITPAGIPWFWPLDWSPPLLPKVLAIRTGSFMETIFFIGLIVVYAIFLAEANYIILPGLN